VKTYTLLGPDGPYESAKPGTLGGNGKAHIYGRLDCPSAVSAIRRGWPYAEHRVFFADEAMAIASGFRPCGNCMREQYRAWKARTSS
jgi:methylphosphotriester-DNA--protein-cysteine methyltransferase